MIREEQLNKAAFDYVNQGGTTAEWSDGWEDFSDAEYVEEAFKAGAEWWHKMLIEKTCDWLRKNTTWECNFYGGANPNKNKIEDFRKAMEE